MKTLDKGQDKLSKICAVLRDETLEPAQKEAQAIIEKANQQADHMIDEARKTIEKMFAEAKDATEQESNVFQVSMQQAAKQSLETLRQSIESKFFNEHLSAVIEKETTDSQLVANLINGIVKILEKDGLSADLTALVSKTVPPREVNKLLLQEVLKVLKNHSVEIGPFNAGVQLKLNNKKMTIDISESALKELLATHVVRKDFRKMIYNIPN